MVRVVLPSRRKVALYLAFGRSTTPIHGKGCAGRRKVVIPRSRARPHQSMVRVAFPIDGLDAGSDCRKKDNYSEIYKSDIFYSSFEKLDSEKNALDSIHVTRCTSF